MALDNDFGLIYRWQHCPDCEVDTEWLEDEGQIFCAECWELLCPLYADAGTRWRAFRQAEWVQLRFDREQRLNTPHGA